VKPETQHTPDDRAEDDDIRFDYELRDPLSALGLVAIGVMVLVAGAVSVALFF
jgi:hypothetical protein